LALLLFHDDGPTTSLSTSMCNLIILWGRCFPADTLLHQCC